LKTLLHLSCGNGKWQLRFHIGSDWTTVHMVPRFAKGLRSRPTPRTLLNPYVTRLRAMPVWGVVIERVHSEVLVCAVGSPLSMTFAV
jgi:hypothetical protein